MDEKSKRISWVDFFYPLCTLMLILTFVFFAPLISIETSKGSIQCSILELLKLKGQYGTAESIIYFVMGWVIAWLLDKAFAKKIARYFSKAERTARMKELREYNEEKERARKNKKAEEDEDLGELIEKAKGR